MFYRQLPVFSLSGKYTVEISQGNVAAQPIFVYQTNNDVSGMVTKVEHFTSFAFDPKGGAVTIRVSLKNGTPLNASTVELVNKTYTDITTAFDAGTFVITAASPKKHLFVRLKSDYGNPLMIFADPYALTPIPSGANVVTFKASSSAYVQSAQYDRYTIPNDVDAVVVEDGALIQGTIHTNSGRTKPLLLQGRGVVLGNGPIIHGTTGIPYNAVVITKGSGHRIEGLTVIKSRHFGIDIGNSCILDNCKMYGYNTNNDGVVGGDKSIIENCFLKVNDDFIKLYNDEMRVRNCTFYVQQNGGVFQFAWNSITPGSNCVVENCELVAVEYTGCGDPKLGQGGIAHCFISLRESDAHPASANNIFRNILVQGQLAKFIGINGKYDGSASLSLKNTLLENITVEKKPTSYSWIYTGNAPDEVSVRFKNVMLAGKSITKDEFHTEGNVILTFDPVSIYNPVYQSVRTKQHIFALPVYQNSTQTYFRIDASGYTGLLRLQVVNMLGRVLMDDIYNPGIITVPVEKMCPGFHKAILSAESSKTSNL